MMTAGKPDRGMPWPIVRHWAFDGKCRLTGAQLYSSTPAETAAWRRRIFESADILVMNSY
jgi:hypothetical protein